LKDLPTTPTAGLVIGAIPERADARDVLVSQYNYTLETLPIGAKVGTSSVRRSAQLLHSRPDLNITDIRGNIDTRVRKALDGQYDAIVLAHAGLERLNQLDVVTQTLSFEAMLPAPGQGALAVQCRDEADLLQLLEPINHTLTMTAITVERTFLASLDAGCSLPVAAYAEINGQHLNVRGRVTAPDGSKQIDVSTGRWLSLPDDVSLLEIGKKLAEEAIEQGAKVLLTGGQV
jgi:hydroxymethylbilane synthase